MTTLEIQTAFEAVLPELESRLHYLSSRFAEPDEAISEMLASCWINFRSKALRTRVFLGAGASAWMARIRLQSGRTNCGYSNADVLAEQTFKSGRVRVLLLSHISTNKPRHALTDDEIGKITKALSTSEHERPRRHTARLGRTDQEFGRTVATHPARAEHRRIEVKHCQTVRRIARPCLANSRNPGVQNPRILRREFTRFLLVIGNTTGAPRSRSSPLL